MARFSETDSPTQRVRLMLRAKIALGILVGLLLGHAATVWPVVVCTPFGSLTAALQLCKPATGEIGWDAAINNNFTILDASLTATNQTQVINGQSNFVNYNIAPSTNAGTTQQVGLWLHLTGASSLGAGNFRIPLFLSAETGGSDGVIPLNIVATQRAADPVAFLSGLELAVNNLKRNDPLDPVDQNHFGMTIDAYGGFSTGPAAVAIRTATANSNWQRGIWIPVNSITPSTGLAFDYAGNGTQGAFQVTEKSAVQPGSFVFANIAAVLTANGMMSYCSDCTIANPCAGGGTGAIAKRLNSINVCN